LWLILPPRARLWGLIWIGVAGILALATWPETWAQIQTAIAFPRPFRLDYLLLLWAAVPWIWAHPRLLEPAEWPTLASEIKGWSWAQWMSIRTADRPVVAAVAWVERQVRVLLGLQVTDTRAPAPGPSPEPVATPPAPAS
jgi:hypothetical protein